MKTKPQISPVLIAVIILVLVLMNVVAIYWISSPGAQDLGWRLPFSANAGPPATITPSVTPSETPSPTASITPSPLPPTATSTATPYIPFSLVNPDAQSDLVNEGVLILSMRDGAYTHLFAYHPSLLPLTRLTNQPWDEMHPALSPDGTRLAYTSRQNGYWDLFILDLQTGDRLRLTDTTEYEGSPTWSPDSQWLAYEAYVNGNLDIYLRSLTDPSMEPILLTTESPGIDRAPAWSPLGRQIAFISDRSGDADIWLADLDVSNDRFTNLSRNPKVSEDHPVWSPEGRFLSWASPFNGEHRILAWDRQSTAEYGGTVGIGDWPAWTPAADVLFTTLSGPNQTSLDAFERITGLQRMPQFNLPGTVYGLLWKNGPLDGWLWEQIQRGDISPADPLYSQVFNVEAEPAGRAALVPLQDVTAPNPYLLDAVDEAFDALRHEIGAASGWDALSGLENAFVPITTPSLPLIAEDWLLTGRAFSFNPLLASAGWIVTVREEFAGQTYWRVYLKARYQDGSAGMPLFYTPWDTNARFSGVPSWYDQGGKPAEIPAGYWIDLTELALRFDWERLPSTANWQTYYPGLRFNQFVMREGLEWQSAIVQVYPAEALATPTSVPTHTPTPTETRRPTRAWVTPTVPPTPTPSITPRPTLTPAGVN
ncbi:MAG: PD40 domain-containing protein [Anaerolineaceae bacterium]|nr:PD40 domain-containing protein [Anaerolineaceae bacterium]